MPKSSVRSKEIYQSILVEKMKKNSGLVQIIMQEQCGKHGKQDGHVSALSLFFRNNQQDDKDNSGVNKSKTIINQQC